MATRLYRHNGARPKEEDSLKLKINCKNRISTNSETKDWLELVEQFKHTSGFVKVYKALVDKNKTMVAKIGKYKLEHEYSIATKLDELKLPTFIHLTCIFTCKDDFSSLNSTTKEVCRGAGLSIIIMPYVDGKLIDKYEWNRKNFHIMKNVMKHICLSMMYANHTLGFVHGDLHLGNVILKNTERKEISYGEFGNLEAMGLMPIIMDFDKSAFSPTNYKNIFSDLDLIINLISTYCSLTFKSEAIRIFLKKNKDSMEPVLNISTHLCNLIDNIEILDIPSEKPPMPNFLKPQRV
jgi:hypothetical protein